MKKFIYRTSSILSLMLLFGCDLSPNPLIGKWILAGSKTIEFTNDEVKFDSGGFCRVDKYNQKMAGNNSVEISFSCTDSQSGITRPLNVMIFDNDTLIYVNQKWVRAD